MSMTSEPTKNYEDFLLGIDNDEENNNVLNKDEEKDKTVSDVKQQVYEDDISNVIKNKDILSDCKDNAYPANTQVHQTCITDCYTEKTLSDPDSQVTEIECIIDDDRANKKKLKKLRQKLKKKTKKTSLTKETKVNEMEVIKEEDEVKEIQKECVKEDSPATTSYDLDHVDKHNDIEDNNDIQDNSDEEIDFSNYVPAFVHAALKKDKKFLTTNTHRQSKQNNVTNVKFKERNFSSETLNGENNEYYDIDLENDFTLVKYKHSKHPDFLQSSEDFAISAINLILTNQISEATRYISTAINLDPKNVCHYVNRSFCFLRAGIYGLAIKDANFVLKNTSDNKILAKASYLLGKAYFSLKNYEEAEKSIQKCLELFPQNLCYIRELLCFKVSQLVNMGFCEKDALLTLRSHSTVMDAMEKLIADTNRPTNSYSTDNCDTIFMSYDETEIFYSDDEDNCSNTQLLSSIIIEKFPLCHDRVNKKFNKKPVKNISKTTRKLPK